jgi:hypothetical protein
VGVKHAETVERLSGSDVELASYEVEDVRSWLQKVPRDAPVCSFPSFYGGGYEKLYEPLEAHFTWDAPEYEPLSDDDVVGVLGAITGCLTSTPLVWNDRDTGRLGVLSGNHRTLAAIEAGLPQIWWTQIDEPLPRQRQIALQLSRNAIAGQDDPAILKELYDELESVEWRQCTGLDDKAPDLLEKVDVASLGESEPRLRQHAVHVPAR